MLKTKLHYTSNILGGAAVKRFYLFGHLVAWRTMGRWDDTDVEMERRIADSRIAMLGLPYCDPDAEGPNPKSRIYPDGTIVGNTDYGWYIRHVDGTVEGGNGGGHYIKHPDGLMTQAMPLSACCDGTSIGVAEEMLSHFRELQARY